MGIYKIEIEKERSGGVTKFKYPKGYSELVFSPFLYQNEGKDKEYCLAKADDTKAITNDKIVKITKTEAKKLIDSFVNNDKDIKGQPEANLTVEQVKEKRKKKLKSQIE